MKRILLFLLLAMICTFGTCNYSFAQESITLDRQTAESALKAIELVPKLEAEIVELKKLNKELELQKTTPCSISIRDAERLIVAIPLGEPDDTKAVIKARGEQRKLVKMLIINTVKSQCNWQSPEPFWKTLLKYAPIAAAVLLK